MNKYLVTVILMVACIGLAVALIIIKTRERQEQAANAGTILAISTQLTNAQDQLTGLNQVNLVLSNNLAASQESTLALSNQLGETRGRLCPAGPALPGRAGAL